MAFSSRECGFIAVNAQRKLGDSESVRSLLDKLDCMSWKPAFISELDAFGLSRPNEGSILECCSPHVLIRSYPGPGSCSFAWLVHEDLVPMLKHVIFRGRASSVEFAGAGLRSLVCIGVRGYRGQDGHLETISDAATLIATQAQT